MEIVAFYKQFFVLVFIYNSLHLFTGIPELTLVELLYIIILS